jgi:hypothetical protein
MVTEILLEQQGTITNGVLTVQVDQKIEIKVPAEDAQRQVSRFVHMEISTQMHAETPTLVINNKATWRVPVHLTFPSFGDVGCVGFIHVDPTTGELETPSSVIKEIEHNAEALAVRFTSPATQPS